MKKVMELIDSNTWFMIDVDGVLIDTIQRLHVNYPAIISKRMTWKQHIFSSTQINSSLNILREVQGKINKIQLLTKNESFEEETAKNLYLRSQGIIVPIISVPIFLSKSFIAPPVHYDNNVILVDDDIENLNDWMQHGGKSVLFDSGDNYTTSKYPKVKSLEFLREVAQKYYH